MKTKRLIRLVTQSIRRNRRDFVFSSIGIVIGISTLIFFTSLGQGIKSTVLERVFVIQQLEVVKPSYQMGAFQSEGLLGGKKLTDRTVERLRGIDGVAGVYPKMKLTFPASARGGESLLGKDMWAELIADGIPPGLVEEELEGELAFRDFGGIECTDDSACPQHLSCVEGTCQGNSCSPRKDDCPGDTYCAEPENRCTMPIPVVISPKLLEIYNGSLHTALGGAKGGLSSLPKLSEDALIGFSFEGVLGKSYLGEAKEGGRASRRMRLVGFSDKAMDLGVTMPIGYVKRFNARFGTEGSSEEYHSILVETQSNEAVPRVAQTITETMGYGLSDKYQNAQRAGLLIMLVTLVFNLISLVILAIAAVNIMHTFLMIILERRRELALMRALGARGSDIRWLVLGEASFLGLVGGTIGIVLGWAATLGVDILFDTQIGDFPFKPESLFVFEWWMFAGALAVAIFFCWFGALLPAIRASKIDPASALAGR